MKLIKSRTLFACLLIAALFSSCVTDDEGFIIERNPDNSDIFGVVTNNANEPISEALVSYRGNTVLTDEDGVYRFNDVEVGPQHNALKIEKEGYFESSRTFRTATSGVLYQSTVLQEQNFNFSFQSNAPGLVEDNRVSIRIPANSIMVEESGASYTGEVLVAMSPIDPTVDRLAENMPGDLSAIEDDNTIATLQTFGMVYVEMQSPTGVKLQIAENQNVEMSYVISDDFLSKAPETIDMWSFDFDRGVWVKEGQATLNGNRYTGLVNHFSCWNYDVSAPSVVVSGQIITNLGNLSYFRVSILNEDNKGGRGSTDDQGRFSGRVEAGVQLTLNVTESVTCQRRIIHTESIGSFNTDTDLGVIMIDVDPLEYLTVTGTALDCNQNPLASGKIFTQGRTFPVTNGVIDVVSLVCGSNNTDLRIVDLNSLQQVVVPDIPFPGVQDLNEVFICDEEAFHFTVDNFFADPFVHIDSIESRVDVDEVNNFTVVSIFSISFRENDEQVISNLSFILGDASTENIEVGDYDIRSSRFSNIDLSFNGNVDVPVLTMFGTVTILSVIENDSGQNIISGTYSAETIERDSGELRVITGSFNITVRN